MATIGGSELTFLDAAGKVLGTEHQSEIEKKQLRNLARALELIKATAGYPEGARYKWNVEVLWAVESFLRQAPPEQQREFFDAVRNGQMGLQAMYGNELTGLCRPEELRQLFAYATRLGRQCGVPVDNAMISDVPGYTRAFISCGLHSQHPRTNGEVVS